MEATDGTKSGLSWASILGVIEIGAHVIEGNLFSD